MIKSYRDKRTARFAEGKRVRQFEPVARQIRTRLVLLDSADSIGALAAIPGNRLEALKGDRTGQMSIRINDQWRICFIWNEAERCAELVEIVDYH